MTSEDRINSESNLAPSTMVQKIAEVDSIESSEEVEPAKKTPNSNSCQYCCCRFPMFVGSTLKSSRSASCSDCTEYKPYFELETEEEKLKYEYFKLLARVTYDEIVEKHREQALEELHQYRLSLLLEELRLIEQTEILYSSSDECYPQFEFRIPNKKRTLRMKNKRRFQRQKIRK